MNTTTTNPTSVIITTMINGRKNYIHSFATGMRNRLLPRYTINPGDAVDFPSEVMANHAIERISDGAKRQFEVEPIPCPITAP